jgi:PAS domain S-box-containing protein
MNISGKELPEIAGKFRDFGGYCNSIVGNAVKPVSLTLAVLFFVISISHLFVLEASIRVYMASLAGLSALLLTAIGFIFREHEGGHKNPHMFVFSIAFVIMINSLVLLALTGDPIQTTNLMLLLIGIGSFMLSWFWLIIVISLTDLGFLTLIPFLSPAAQTIHFSFGLLGASVLSALIMLTRLRAYKTKMQLHESEYFLRSELEQTVAQTQAREQRYQLLMRNSSDVIWSCDPDGKYTYVSPSSISFCGFTPEEIMQRNLEDLLGVQTFNDLMSNISSNGTWDGLDYFLFEVEHLCKTGNSIWVEAKISPSYDKSGQIIGFQGINRDITRRIAAQAELFEAHDHLEARVQERTEELEQANENYREEIKQRKIIAEELRHEKEFASAILLNSTDGFSIFTKDGTIKFISKAMEDFFEADIKQIRENNDGVLKLGDIFKMHFTDKEKQRKAVELYNEDVEKGNPPPREFYLAISDGSHKWLRLQISSLASGEDLLLTAQDITESKEKEQQLQKANEELRKLDELKNNFLSNISHELRTPLVAVKGYIELLLRGFPDLERAREWLDTALSSTRRLEHIIEDLINISRLHSKRMTFRFRPLDIGKIITGCAKEMSPRLESKEISLAMNGLSQVWPVFADQKKIQSVVINLLDNAVKFSSPGSKVAIEVTRKDDNFMLISVSDNGIGISEEYLDKVFNRFFQVDSSPTRSYDGSGIGLALVKEIIEAHNGKVWARSDFDKGTIFSFLLPMADPALVERAQEKIQTTKTPREDKMANILEVLVVDDDPYIREFITTMLQLERHNVVLASDGAQCLNLLENKPVDVVLLDIAMPGINGIEVCKRIRGNPRLAALPVYMLTARTGAKEKKDSADAGANGFIEKPFSIEFLSDILKQVSVSRA